MKWIITLLTLTLYNAGWDYFKGNLGASTVDWQAGILLGFLSALLVHLQSLPGIERKI